MAEPRTDRRIDITPAAERVRVRFAGRTIVDTTRAMVLDEEGHKPMLYVPRDDADMALLSRTDHTSHCPFKGDASYFTIAVDGRSAENAVWSYEAPYPLAERVKDYLAFYPDRVDAIETLPV